MHVMHASCFMFNKRKFILLQMPHFVYTKYDLPLNAGE